MLTIRLQRIGRRNEPHFRVVVAEHTTGPKSGKFVEKVGFRNPKTKEQKLDAERIQYWISVGAQPTDTVHNMLVKEGIIKGETRNVLPQKSPVVKEQPEEEAKEAEAPAEEGGETTDEQVDDVVEENVEETEAPAEEVAEETTEDAAPAEEVKEEEKKEEEAPAEETQEEEPAEEEKSE